MIRTMITALALAPEAELDFDMTSLVGTQRGAGHSQISVVQVKHLVRSRRSQWTCSSRIAS